MPALQLRGVQSKVLPQRLHCLLDPLLKPRVWRLTLSFRVALYLAPRFEPEAIQLVLSHSRLLRHLRLVPGAREDFILPKVFPDLLLGFPLHFPFQSAFCKLQAPAYENKYRGSSDPPKAWRLPRIIKQQPKNKIPLTQICLWPMNAFA